MLPAQSILLVSCRSEVPMLFGLVASSRSGGFIDPSSPLETYRLASFPVPRQPQPFADVEAWFAGNQLPDLASADRTASFSWLHHGPLRIPSHADILVTARRRPGTWLRRSRLYVGTSACPAEPILAPRIVEMAFTMDLVESMASRLFECACPRTLTATTARTNSQLGSASAIRGRDTK